MGPDAAPGSDTPANELVVVLNWLEELRTRASN